MTNSKSSIARKSSACVSITNRKLSNRVSTANRKPRQLSLIKKEKIEIQCGGDKRVLAHDEQSIHHAKYSSAIGKRKVRRPLATGKPMHIILKSGKAKGRYAFSPSRHDLKQLTQKMGRRFGVAIYGAALNWSHIHMVVRVPSRLQYVRFIRALTGALVLRLKSRIKNNIQRSGEDFKNLAIERFFDQTVFTKPGSWGVQLKNWLLYLEKNERQASGV